MITNKTNLILRSPDDLDMPAGDIDTSFPRLREGVYKMIIRSPEKKRNSKDTADMLVFRLETTEEGRDTDGNKLHPGFKFIHRINGDSGERTKEALVKDLAALLQGVEGLKSPTRPLSGLWDKPEHIADKLVYVKVGLQPAKDGFPESNKVSSWIPPEKHSSK